MLITDLKDGDRVRLAAFQEPDNGIFEPESNATVLLVDIQCSMVVVELDQEFIEDAGDDGMRECLIEQILNKIEIQS